MSIKASISATAGYQSKANEPYPSLAIYAGALVELRRANLWNTLLNTNTRTLLRAQRRRWADGRDPLLATQKINQTYVPIQRTFLAFLFCITRRNHDNVTCLIYCYPFTMLYSFSPLYRRETQSPIVSAYTIGIYRGRKSLLHQARGLQTISSIGPNVTIQTHVLHESLWEVNRVTSQIPSLMTISFLKFLRLLMNFLSVCILRRVGLDFLSLIRKWWCKYSFCCCLTILL